MRTIDSGELAAWLGSGSRAYRVRVKRPGEADWTNLSDILGGDWVLSIAVDGDTPDQPAGRFSIRFIKHATEGSLSPGINASSLNIDAALAVRPLLDVGRDIEVDAKVDAYDWRLWLQGQTEDTTWAGDSITALCLSLDAAVNANQIETEAFRCNPPEPIEVEIQGLLTAWADPPVTLLVEGTPAKDIGGYQTTPGSLGEWARTLAQRIAWDLRYKWSETDQNFRYTLYEPPRYRTELDSVITFAPNQCYAVNDLRKSRQYVRNAIHVDYKPVVGVGGAPEWSRVTRTDTDSITEYRRRGMVLQEDTITGSDVDTEFEAENLAEAALSDLARPLIDARYQIPFLPWLELHDIITIEADDDHFDHDVSYAITGISHRVEEDGGGAWTELELKSGSPVGSYLAWYTRRRAAGVGTSPHISALNAERTADGDCALSEPMVHTVTAIFNAPGETDGYFWDLFYSFDGLATIQLAGALPLTTTTFEHEIDDAEYDEGSAVVQNLTYTARMYRDADSVLVHTMLSPTIVLPRTWCP